VRRGGCDDVISAIELRRSTEGFAKRGFRSGCCSGGFGVGCVWFADLSRGCVMGKWRKGMSDYMQCWWWRNLVYCIMSPRAKRGKRKGLHKKKGGERRRRHSDYYSVLGRISFLLAP
jgi:hypothetical protein